MFASAVSKIFLAHSMDDGPPIMSGVATTILAKLLPMQYMLSWITVPFLATNFRLLTRPSRSIWTLPRSGAKKELATWLINKRIGAD